MSTKPQRATPVSNADGTPIGGSVPNGGNVAIGSTTDTTYTSGTGTAISILKGIFGKLAGMLTADVSDRATRLLGTVRLQDNFGNGIAQQTPGDTITGASTTSLATTNFKLRYNGSQWQRERVPVIFKVVSLTAATAEATIWTPTTGKKFRLMGFILTCGAASTLTFKDSTAGTTIFASRGTTDIPSTTPPMGDGILSATVNNPLTVTRGTSCTLDGVVFGTEE